jgi:hypothetical protein
MQQTRLLCRFIVSTSLKSNDVVIVEGGNVVGVGVGATFAEICYVKLSSYFLAGVKTTSFFNMPRFPNN